MVEKESKYNLNYDWEPRISDEDLETQTSFSKRHTKYINLRTYLSLIKISKIDEKIYKKI